MSDEEKRALEDSIDSIISFGAREEIIRHGQPVDRSLMLLEGIICRYMDGLDGDRQLVALHVPGDFVDLHGFPMGVLDHDVAALTACTVACFKRDTIERLRIAYTNLGRLLWFSTLLDAAMHREWIFRLGRLGAQGRVAHFFAEIGRRLEMVGLGTKTDFRLPLQQSDVASACGLTTVHVNRVLRELRERGIVTFANAQVQVHDLATLHVFAEFDDGYLYPSKH